MLGSREVNVDVETLLDALYVMEDLLLIGEKVGIN